MNGVSPSKNTTVVFSLVFAAAVALPAISRAQATTSVGAGLGKAAYESLISAACSDLKGSDLAECRREQARRALGGGSFETELGKSCRAKIELFTKAETKYAEACSNVGIPEDAGEPDAAGTSKRQNKRPSANRRDDEATRTRSCHKIANDCSRVSLPEWEEDADEVDKEDLLGKCRSVAKECPLLGATTLADNKKDIEEARESHDDRRDKYVSAQKDLQSLQEDMMASQSDVLESQVNMQRKAAEANRGLETALQEAEREKVVKTQALREGFAKIDEEYVKLRSQLEQTNAAINEEQDKVQKECERSADTFWDRVQANKQARKAMGSNTQRSATQLAGVEKRRQLEYQRAIRTCLSKKSTRNQFARLEERRTVTLKNAMDLQVLLETRRATMIRNLQEAEALAEAARNTAARQLQERLQEQQNAAARAMQENMSKQSQKGQEMASLQGRLRDADTEVGNAARDRRRAEFRQECSRLAAKNSPSGSSDTDTLKGYNLFKSAASLHRKLRDACDTAIETCGRVKPVEYFTCLGKSTQPSTQSRPPASGADRGQ